MAQTQKDKWGTKTVKEQSEWAEKCRNAQLAMTDEAKDAKTQKAIETYSNKSDQEKAEIDLRRSKSCTEYWNTFLVKNTISKKPLTVDDLLPIYNIKFERDVIIDTFLYEFKINNILINLKNKHFDKYYHINKSRNVISRGYRCIHIWDWEDAEKVIHTFIDKQPIYARNCEIHIISEQITNQFLTQYHIQGVCLHQDICLGLYYNNTLVQVMTFGKPRYNKKFQFELLRLCTKSDYAVVGGAEKLFTYFTKTYNPESIISYCDLSKFLGDVYIKLGMTQIFAGKPNLHWYNAKTNNHITDNLLRQRGFNQLLGKEYGEDNSGLTNQELMIKNGFVEIYDAGQATFVWRKDELN